MNLLKNKNHFACIFSVFGFGLLLSFYFTFQKENIAEIANWQRDCRFFEAFPLLKHAYTFEKDATTTAIDFCPEKLDGKIYGAKLTSDRFDFNEGGLQLSFGSFILLPQSPFHTNSDFTLHIWLKLTSIPKSPTLLLGHVNPQHDLYSPSIFITRTLGNVYLKSFVLFWKQKPKTRQTFVLNFSTQIHGV